GHPRRVWQLCCRDAPADPSPNAGWSECAYAAALGVQLGGQNIYRGEVKQKPLLAESTRPITSALIVQGLQLTQRASLSWLLVGSVGLWARYGLS
ncbi:MAG: cobalamin biosynthesis protein, partial [Cyanobacteria bacterium P01_C01_bin.70]